MRADAEIWLQELDGEGSHETGSSQPDCQAEARLGEAGMQGGLEQGGRTPGPQQLPDLEDIA